MINFHTLSELKSSLYDIHESFSEIKVKSTESNRKLIEAKAEVERAINKIKSIEKLELNEAD